MKQDVNSILLANYYFMMCKIDNPDCKETELARKYLTSKIEKALSDRSKKKESHKEPSMSK